MFCFLPSSAVKRFKKKRKNGSCLREGSRRTRQFQILSPSALRLLVIDPFLRLQDSTLEAFFRLRVKKKQLFLFAVKKQPGRVQKHDISERVANTSRRLHVHTGGILCFKTDRKQEEGWFHLREDAKHHYGVNKKGEIPPKGPDCKKKKKL